MSDDPIAAAFDVAQGWRQKGDLRWELTALSSGVTQAIATAVGAHPDATSGIGFLAGKNVAEALRRMAELNRALLTTFRARSTAPTTAVDTSPTPVHAAWLLETKGVAEAYLEAASDADVLSHFPLTPFWREYVRALVCLSERTPYSPAGPKPKGYERYWFPYLELVAALTGGAPVGAAIEACNTSFLRRNADKRLRDWCMIDGDGVKPVLWDFRLASIQAFWTTRPSVSG